MSGWFVWALLKVATAHSYHLTVLDKKITKKPEQRFSQICILDVEFPSTEMFYPILEQNWITTLLIFLLARDSGYENKCPCSL